MFSKTESNTINKLCNKYGFEYIYYDEMIYIKSKFDSWRIIKDDAGYKLYHKNKSMRTNYLNNICDNMENYHLQTECKDVTKISNIINYLHNHDMGLLKRYKSKKTSVDIMFEKITNPERYKIT